MNMSFIVPVYNTEIGLLEKCLLSIEELEINDYEIIIINDGSNKSNTRKYEDFLKNKKNIVYIRNLNKGVSYSRNCGIKKATKDYITFVDSDDVVIHEYYNKISIEPSEDIILLKYYNKSTNESVEYSFMPGPITNDTMLREAVSTCNYCSPFAKLFKREYLVSHNILFDESFVQGEDVLFNLRCLEFNPTIRYYDVLFYEYNYDSSGTEKRWRDNFKKCLDNKYYIYSKKQELIRSLCAPNERKDLLVKNDNEFVKAVFHSYKFLISMNDDKRIKQYVDRFKLIKLKKKDLGLKERLYYGLLMNDGIFARKIVNIIRRIK